VEGTANDKRRRVQQKTRGGSKNKNHPLYESSWGVELLSLKETGSVEEAKGGTSYCSVEGKGERRFWGEKLFLQGQERL